MTDNDLVERLSRHRTLGSAPREELEWLAAHGTVQQLAAGELVATKNSPIENIWIVLSGRLAIFVDRGTGPQKMMEWREGDVSGVLPYSRMKNPPGDTSVLEESVVLAIPQGCHREMIRECYEVTSILVHTMVDRARVFNATELHDEKMVSLGKLAAGLAHELNNPASAIERSAALLQGKLSDSERAARALGSVHLSDAQLAVVDGTREACLATRAAGVRSPIEQAEREDAIADWLSAHGLDPGDAGPVAETSVTIETLDRLAAAVESPALGTVLRWAGDACAVRALAREIQEAAIRISGIVLAVKGFTHMDQATVAEPVDLAKGLDNTVAVLRSKVKAKSASVAVEVEPGLPRVRGFVGELNQVWGNLIDNALDAIPDGGRVDVSASRENRSVVVRIVDNGSGIPEKIKGRIFDPFFTTKPMGEGTGLGLDIVHRLVRHNDGEISVESRPGRTEFRVVLPVADTAQVP
ncbi:MAG: ATP-binding protein [Thermoanaerobaculia bacterium]